jgi:hypothetical protein
MVSLRKMKPSTSEYACKITILMKKDGNRRFCGDYHPLKLHTKKDALPMSLVEDILHS